MLVIPLAVNKKYQNTHIRLSSIITTSVDWKAGGSKLLLVYLQHRILLLPVYSNNVLVWFNNYRTNKLNKTTKARHAVLEEDRHGYNSPRYLAT